MKRSILMVVLSLAVLPATTSGTGGGTPADCQNNQNDTRQAGLPAARSEERPSVAYDMHGKRLRARERYVAERTLGDGRVIAYRKNRREIAALVKALKEDGVTDEKLLDPNTWMMNICWKTLATGCNGGCGQFRPCVYSPVKHVSDQRVGSGNNTAVLIGSCRCG